MSEQDKPTPEGAEDWDPSVKKYIEVEGENRGRVKDVELAREAATAEDRARDRSKKQSHIQGDTKEGMERGADKAGNEIILDEIQEEARERSRKDFKEVAGIEEDRWDMDLEEARQARKERRIEEGQIPNADKPEQGNTYPS